MDEGFTAGQLWIDARIRELPEGTIHAFEWEDPSKRDAKAFLEGSVGLTVFIGSQRRVISFQESELEDVVGNAEVQARVLRWLRKALR